MRTTQYPVYPVQRQNGYSTDRLQLIFFPTKLVPHTLNLTVLKLFISNSPCVICFVCVKINCVSIAGYNCAVFLSIYVKFVGFSNKCIDFSVPCQPGVVSVYVSTNFIM